MKKKLAAFALILFLSISFISLFHAGIIFDLTRNIPFSPSRVHDFNTLNLHSQDCDQTLWNHVYAPQRLYMVDTCIKVRGVVSHTFTMPDGDTHITLTPDTEFKSLTNIFNFPIGGLVLEAVCQSETTEEDVENACQGDIPKINTPKKGDHIEVTGSFVLDKGYGWMEIHPITSITSL